MEIFITGDTHGDFCRFRPDIFYEQEHMTREALVLVCGDYTVKNIMPKPFILY